MAHCEHCAICDVTAHMREWKLQQTDANKNMLIFWDWWAMADRRLQGKVS